MSIIFIDSFDDNLSSSKWTSGTAPLTATNPRTGIQALSGETNNLVRSRSFAAGDQHATFIVGMGYFQVVDADRTGMTFIDFIGGTRHIAIRRNVDGSVTIVFGGTIGEFGTDVATSAPNIILNGFWYWLDIKVFLDNAAGTVEVKVNNTSVVSFAGDTRNAGNAVFDRVQVFSNYLGDSINARIDDFIIANGAGATNNNFLGNCRVHNLLPDANGNYSQWVGSDGDSINNYLLVDENPPNTSDYVGSGTSGNKDSYNFPSLPVAVTSVLGVAQRAYAATSDAGARAARNLTRIAGVDYVGADYNLGAGYLMYETIYNVSPATTIAFTPAEFNAAEWGIECRA